VVETSNDLLETLGRLKDKGILISPKIEEILSGKKETEYREMNNFLIRLNKRAKDFIQVDRKRIVEEIEKEVKKYRCGKHKKLLAKLKSLEEEKE